MSWAWQGISAISTPLLNISIAKMGEEASVSVLQGVTQREVSLKIDVNNLKLFYQP